MKRGHGDPRGSLPMYGGKYNRHLMTGVYNKPGLPQPIGYKVNGG